MIDLIQLAKEHQNLPESEQKAAGRAIAGAMDDEHKNFLQTISRMINEKEIDVAKPETFLKRENYDVLKEADRSQVDLSMVNIVDLLRHIAEFFFSKQTPNESPHLQTMIEQLWQMKERVETKYGDVFKF